MGDSSVWVKSGLPLCLLPARSLMPAPAIALKLVALCGNRFYHREDLPIGFSVLHAYQRQLPDGLGDARYCVVGAMRFAPVRFPL